ncbi:uncharacterized protein LOC123661849 [Melitaea cinxia]|uniref:uncharacterized protein LOC123661849 n=1 Tax=Melitaea cinxia TaxID=113334 RepID=UPI001E2726F4|nr:uncharacterized protein LOC123661849 [Melitaea cinxia]
MLRSPNKQYCSDPDISRLSEPHNITVRKRKHDDDCSEELKHLTSNIANKLDTWKAEIQNNISQIKKDLESVLKTDFDKLNTSFSEVKSEISCVRLEYQEIKKSMQSLKLKQEETIEKVEDLEKSVQFHKSLETRIKFLENEHKLLKIELNSNYQRDRLLNLEVFGVIETRNENLPDLILSIAKHACVKIDSDDILEVNRITPKNNVQGRPRNIIVKMKSRLLKENIISGIRKKHIMNQDLGIVGNTSRVYVNEHLTQFNKILFKKCREAANHKSYQYVWTKNGRIFVRRNDTSPVVQIKQEEDIARIV